MGAYLIKREHVKQWVVQNAHVNNPYKKYWSASVTLGYDYNGEGGTIEKAYNDLVDKIMKSPTIMATLKDVKSFVNIVKQ